MRLLNIVFAWWGCLVPALVLSRIQILLLGQHVFSKMGWVSHINTLKLICRNCSPWRNLRVKVSGWRWPLLQPKWTWKWGFRNKMARIKNTEIYCGLEDHSWFTHHAINLICMSLNMLDARLQQVSTFNTFRIFKKFWWKQWSLKYSWVF